MTTFRPAQTQTPTLAVEVGDDASATGNGRVLGLRLNVYTCTLEDYDELIKTLPPSAANHVSEWMRDRCITFQAREHVDPLMLRQSKIDQKELFGNVYTNLAYGMAETFRNLVIGATRKMLK